MAQVFHPATNSLAKFTIVVGAGALVMLLGVIKLISLSSYVTQTNVIREQPIPFSHEHHVNKIGLDCRFCHATAEISATAGMPSTEVCIGCHSQIHADSQMLAPVHESYRTGRPIAWTRVHDMPDFVYFDHSVHVNNGIGCSRCHGRVDRMPLMWKANSMHMEWCLDCHRNPAELVRPEDKSYVMDWHPAVPSETAESEEVDTQKLTNCSVCHR